MVKIKEIFKNEDSMYTNQWLVKFDDGVEATTDYEFIEVHKDGQIIESYHKCQPSGDYGQILDDFMTSPDPDIIVKSMAEKHVKRWLELQPSRRVTSETRQGHFVMANGKMTLNKW